MFALQLVTMKKLNQILCAWLCLGFLSAPAHATYPTIDIANIAQNTITAVESKIQSYQAVQQTVALLEQISQLYAMYENGLNVYKSIGNSVDSVRKFNASKLVGSWKKDDFSVKNFGKTLNRWGIKPSEEGALADMNEKMFGSGSAGEALNKMAKDTRKVSREAPRALSRDRFIKGVVKGVKNQEANNEGSDLRITVMDANGATVGERNLTESEKAEALGMAASAQMGSTFVESETYRRVRLEDHKSLEAFAEDTATAASNQDSMQLAATNNALLAHSNKILLDSADQQAALAQQQILHQEAINANLEAERKRQRSESTVKAVLSGF